MNKNQELYIAIGAILKELKTELTGSLSDYIGTNSKFNKDTSENVTLLLDEVESLNEKLNTSVELSDSDRQKSEKLLEELKVSLQDELSDYKNLDSERKSESDEIIELLKDDIESLNEKLGNTNQVIIDTNVESLKQIEDLSKSVEALENIDLADKDFVVVVMDKVSKSVSEVIADLKERTKNNLDIQTEINTDLNADLKDIAQSLSDTVGIVKELLEEDNPSFHYVDNANDAVMKFTIATLNKLRDMANNTTEINKTIMEEVNVNNVEVDKNIKSLISSIFKINDHIQDLLKNKQDTDNKFEAVSDYQKLNKNMVKDQLVVNDTFQEQIEKLFEQIAEKTDTSLLKMLTEEFDKKLLSLEKRSVSLSDKFKNFKPGKAIDDKIKAIRAQVNDKTDIDILVKDIVLLNDLIEDYQLKDLSRFENITAIVATLEGEFTEHKSKSFDLLKSHTEEVQEYVDGKVKDLSESIASTKTDIEELGWNVKNAGKDIEGFSDQLSDHLEDMETVNQNLKKLSDDQDTHQDVLETHKQELTDRKEDMSKLFDNMNTQTDALVNLSESVSVSKSSFEEKIGTIEHDLEDSLSDLNKGVIESRIAKDVLVKAREYSEHLAEISDAKIIGKANEFIVNLASSMKGEKGEDGNIRVCSDWEEEEVTESLDMVMHHCGLWQCLNATDSEPTLGSKDWNLIASGTKEVFTRLVGEDVKLELVTIDSAGEEKIHELNYPLPNLLGTYDKEQDYGFYDSVIWKGHRWISRSITPEGDPAVSEDWVLFSMQGPRGAKGLKGDKGDMPSMESVIKALNQAELNGSNPSIRQWTGMWKYQQSTTQGQMFAFDGGLWLCVSNDNGSVPPSDVNNKNFILMLRGGGAGGSGSALLIDVVHSNPEAANAVGGDVITNMISLSQAEYDAIATPHPTTLYVIVD